MMSRGSYLSVKLRLAAVLFAGLVLAGCAGRGQPESDRVVTQTSLDDRPAEMVSVFFGLDNALPPRSRLLWRGAPGKDGLPVTFSRRVEGPIDADSFSVVTRSGVRLHPDYATLAPADAPSEGHTVLLIGEMGDDPADPPVKVEMTGSLALAGGADARGMTTAVTPLAEGPTLVLAYSRAPVTNESERWPGVRQVVVVVWAGGVRRLPGVDAEAHRLGYVVTTGQGPVSPIGLGDVEDNDNYEHLYLDTQAKLVSVSMLADRVMDPRDDPNPQTRVDVALEK